jgi:hypothetical protein
MRDRELEMEEQSFYAALGKAITQWQTVEEWLAIIFVSATGGMGPNGSALLASFHAIINFNSKVAMVEAALATKVFLERKIDDKAEDNPRYTAWRNLKNRLGKRADRRNEFVHFSLHVEEDNPPGSRFYLSPSAMDVNALIKERGKSPK